MERCDLSNVLITNMREEIWEMDSSLYTLYHLYCHFKSGTGFFFFFGNYPLWLCFFSSSLLSATFFWISSSLLSTILMLA